MPERFADTFNIIEKLWACKDEQFILNVTHDYGVSLGFEAVAIASCGKLLNEAESLPPFVTTVDPNWVNYYVSEALYRVDPLLRMAMRSCRPFKFSETYIDATPDVKRYQEAAKVHGFEFGWGVPVHQSNMAPGVVSFGGRKEVVLDAVSQFRMFIVGMMAYQRASEFFAEMVPDYTIRLTDRERTVLTLVAQGKTNWEVGKVLSISEYSVRDYLKSLSKKLKTSNRTHTVARAMQLGLIVP